MEKTIEKYLCNKVKSAGGMCLKLTNYKGIPDRLILLNGKAVFVEVKDTGKQLRYEQKVFQEKLRDLGFNAYVVDSKDDVDALMCKFFVV